MLKWAHAPCQSNNYLHWHQSVRSQMRLRLAHTTSADHCAGRKSQDRSLNDTCRFVCAVTTASTAAQARATGSFCRSRADDSAVATCCSNCEDDLTCTTAKANLKNVLVQVHYKTLGMFEMQKCNIYRLRAGLHMRQSRHLYCKIL